MDWDQAQNKIKANIKVNTNINTVKSHYRFVKEMDNNRGFAILIGKSKNSHINISWHILRKCFDALASSNGYDGTFFKKQFSAKAKNHPCYVHSIGQIFVKAGIAQTEGKHKYRIRGSRKSHCNKIS